MILLLLKNNWKTLLLILVSVGLTIYLMNGCNKPKPAPLDTHAADSVTRVKDVIIKQKDSAIFEANARSDYWYQKYDSTSRAVELSYKIIKFSKDSLVKLKYLYDATVAERDTLKQLTTCDAFVDQTQYLLGLLDQAKVRLDSAKSFSDSTIFSQKNQITALISEIEVLKSMITDLQAEVLDLKKHDAKMAKKANFNAVVAKVTTVLASVAAILVALHL